MPRYSIITPVYNPPLDVFADTVASVLGQKFEDWQWVLVDDRSPDQGIRDYLADLATKDARITVAYRAENGGIVAASNDAIALAEGEFLVLLDHDDQLLPVTLSTIDAVIEKYSDIDYLYSDESILEDGEIKATFSKPDWSPERLRHQMYTSHVSVLRSSLVREVGGFHDGFNGSQDHDLVLRVTELARRVWHIPEVLYHWRVIPGSTADASDKDAKPYAWLAGRDAVEAHLARVGIAATVTLGRSRGYYEINREIDPDASISVIIPTRGTRGRVRGEERSYLVECVRSLVAKTVTPNVQYVVVYDLDTPTDQLDELRAIAGDALTLVPFDEPFNFSRKCNVGFLHATGAYIVFLNDDMEAFSEAPLENLVAPLDEAGVGMTSARLLFENTTHQHAGVLYGSGTIYPGHYQLPWNHPGNFGSLWVSREVSALTGACLALTRETFEAVGGFSEVLSLNYNDVDLSFKVRALGERLVWLQNVVIFHFESVSRETKVETWEWEYLVARWGPTRQRERYALTP